MMNFPLEGYSCGSHASRGKVAVSQGGFSFSRAEHGAVGVLFALVIFFGMSFVGIALDYGRYVAGKEKIRSFMDQTATRGAGACRRHFLEAMAIPGMTFNQALNIGINYGRDEAARHMQQQVSRTFRGTDLWIDEYSNITYDVKPLLKPNGPNPAKDYCSNAITYNGRVKTTFAGLFGVKEWKVPGRVVAISELTTGGGAPNMEIDFLIDISGSMSTIADPSDRDLFMFLTDKLSISSSSDNDGGCLFVCHMRRALLSGGTSQKILDTIANKPVGLGSPYNITASYNDLRGAYSYTAGTRIVNIKNRVPNTIRQYRYMGTTNSMPISGGGSVVTSSGQMLVMLQDLLDGFGIKLKSDVIYTHMINLLTNIKASPLSAVQVAFHNFSGITSGGSPLNTVLPQKDLKEINFATDLELSHFDYSPPADALGFFPVTRNDNLQNFSPPQGTVPSGSPPALQSVSYNSVKTKPGYEFTAIHPDTNLNRVIDNLRTYMANRPLSSPAAVRIAVILTDGVDNPGGGGPFFLVAPNRCQGLKDDNVIVMVLHSYYRLQPGHISMRQIVQNWGGGVTNLTAANVDEVETTVNNVGIGNALRACASANTNPRPGGETTYYFPASDSAQLEIAFQDLIDSLLELEIKETPVLVTD